MNTNIQKRENKYIMSLIGINLHIFRKLMFPLNYSYYCLLVKKKRERDHKQYSLSYFLAEAYL